MLQPEKIASVSGLDATEQWAYLALKSLSDIDFMSAENCAVSVSGSAVIWLNSGI